MSKSRQDGAFTLEDVPSLFAILIAAHRSKNKVREKVIRREFAKMGVKISFARHVPKRQEND